MSDCEICGKEPSIGVACSVLGAFSMAMGKNCLEKKAENYGLLVGTIADCGGLDHLAEWVWDIIPPSLEVAGKTEEEFKKDIEEEIERMKNDPFLNGEMERAEKEVSEGFEADLF